MVGDWRLPDVAGPWALVSDDPAAAEVARSLVSRWSMPIVAVMVGAHHLMYARSADTDDLRYVTHPAELETMGVRCCVTWRASDLMAAHGSKLRRFSEVHSIDGISAIPGTALGEDRTGELAHGEE